MPKYLSSLNPARPLDPDEWNRSRLDFLLSSYRESESKLTTLLTKELSDAKRLRTGELLTQVRAEIMALNKRAQQWSKTGISHAYQYGYDLTNRTVREYGIAPKISFGNQINSRAIAALSEQAALDLTGANATAQQNFTRLYRATQQKVIEDQALTRAIASGLIEGQTLPQIRSSLVTKLKGALGDGKFVTVNGRNYKPSYYAEMVARTRTREAATVATINMSLQYGIDLVRWDVHGDACPICRTKMGRVYSLVEGNPDFPPLTIRPPAHPNCRCGLLSLPANHLRNTGQYEPLSRLSLDSPQTLDEKEAIAWLKQNPDGDILTLQDMQRYLDNYRGVSNVAVQKTIQQAASALPPTDAIIPPPTIQIPAVAPLRSSAEAQTAFRQYLGEQVTVELAATEALLRQATRLLDDVTRLSVQLPRVYELANQQPIRKLRLVDAATIKKTRQTSAYQPRTQTIAVAMRNPARPTLRYGGWTVDASTSGAYRHALGRHIARTLPKKELDAFGSLLDTGGVAVAGSISLYAAVNLEAAFAEVFSAYTHPDYQERDLPLEIHLFMKRLFGTPAHQEG